LLKEIGLEGVQAEQVMAAADENGDGKLSFEEFCKLEGVDAYGQQDGGHGSRHPLRNV